MYDASETPRAGRGDLPYLSPDEAREYMDDVRERSLSVLESVDPDPFLWEMVVQHEAQHNETMLQTLQLAEPGCTSRQRRQSLVAGRQSPGTFSVPAGSFVVGDPGEGFAYDNERPAHEVELEAFEIDASPVTNGAFAEFLEDGGWPPP